MKLYRESWKIDDINLFSKNLNKEVKVEFYYPIDIPFGKTVEILIFNDGQILEEMGFKSILEKLFKHPNRKNKLFLAAGIYADDQRLQDYGTIDIPNAKKQGLNAKKHAQFIVSELIPYITCHYPFVDTDYTNISGFSLGGLSAFDTAWTYPKMFKKVGVFSGSFWWRSRELDQGYKNDSDRIMLEKLKNRTYQPNLNFFFECGTMDEISDRNNNGVIDSIDDTMDVIKQLEIIGYGSQEVSYMEINKGKHDVPTWSKAMPTFLKWGWYK